MKMYIISSKDDKQLKWLMIVRSYAPLSFT